MALSCIISKLYKASYWSTIAIFIPLAFDAPVRGFPSDCHTVRCGKTRMTWLPEGV